MAVGEVFLGAFLALLLEKLTSPELKEVSGRWKVDEKLKKLEKKLFIIQDVLNDAEAKQIKEKRAKNWLEELKYVAYDIEDILDEFSTEILRRKSEVESQPGTIQVRRKLISSSRVVSFQFEMGSKIYKINKKLKRIAMEKDELNLREGAGERSVGVTLRPPTSSLINESDVYGRDQDKEEIIKLLLSDEPRPDNLSVIPIVGMGGLGKTTLAQLVYNDNKVKQHFSLEVWTYVSEDFNVLNLTKEILVSAAGQSSYLNQLDPFQVELKKIFSTKKFLLVLDDVWNENDIHWCDLLTPFKCGIQGSKIIVTTRSNTVASKVGTIAAPYQLKVLSDDDCLLLFNQRAFVGGTSNGNSKLEAIGKKIVKKCQGSPLAAKTLGGLLRSKTSEKEWTDIMKSEIWDLQEDEVGIFPALRLSYHHLPDHLKRCFAYCSIFPKGHEFIKEALVLLWMAEGLVQPKNEEQMEEKGGEYFDDLFHRSFFQRFGPFESKFVMHDLINDLAQSISRGVCCRLEDILERRQKETTLEKVRHSSYSLENYERITKLEVFYKAKYLRTFLPLSGQFFERSSYLPKDFLHDLFSKLRYLRVLCLSRCYITELPDSISNLKILRYLDLSDTPIERLPDSICTLYSLRTLLVIDCFKLRLPNDMGSLINLRHLEIDSSRLKKMPLGIGRLTNLQKLPLFVVGENGSGASIRELKSLSHIEGKLCISHLENVDNVTDVEEANLKNKQRLHSLTLRWDSNSHGDVFDRLQPPSNLKELAIDSYQGDRFPYWRGDPTSLSNLLSLELIKFGNIKYLPSLGQLPSLEKLIIRKMDGVKTVGHEFYGDGSVKPFQSLKELTFESMRQLEAWYENEEFLSLLKLTIHKCPCLQEIQPCFPALEYLKIKDCENLVTFPSIAQIRDPSPEAEEGSSSMIINGPYTWPTAEEGIHPSLVDKSKEMEDESIPCRGKGIIRIYNCPKLEKMPPFLPPLKELALRGCGKLNALPMIPSIDELGLHRCDEMILTRIVEFTSLYRLYISGFPMSRRLAEGFMRSLTSLTSLKYLILNDCTELEDLGSQMELQDFVSLRELKIFSCPKLVSLPQEDGLPTKLQDFLLSDCNALEKLPGMGLLIELQTLYIRNCEKVESLPMGLDKLNSFQRLEIVNCSNLKFLPEGLYNQKALKYLQISGCSSFVSFPGGGLPTTLTTLQIWDCPNLETLPEGLHNLAFLENFSISECPRLVSFPQGGLPFNTNSVSISQCENLKSLSDWWGFQLLEVDDCPSLIISFSELEINYTCLQSLYVTGCEKLVLPQSGLKNLTTLRKLTIGGCGVEPSLERLQLPTSLSHLCLERCQDLESLPEGLQNLNLDELEIIDCPKLASLPKVGLPTTLSVLVISKCPLLEKRCQKKKGKDWRKIENIPRLSIDGVQ